MSEPAEEPKREQLLVFEVRGAPHKVYAIDVERVLNVLEPMQMTPVPLVPTLVRGIVSNRGRIVTVVDASVLLKVFDGLATTEGAREAPQQTRDNVAQVLVLRDGSRDTGHVGLEVGRIRNLEAAQALGDSVTIVDAEALRAELEVRVSRAVRKQQGVLR